jgi:hypothetical protein
MMTKNSVRGDIYFEPEEGSSGPSSSRYPLPSHAANIWAVDGKLQLGLPSEVPGAWSAVEIDPARSGALELLVEILSARAMAAAKPKLAEPGAPTRAWVQHRQRHADAADDRCPFCRDERRIAAMRRAVEAADAASAAEIVRLNSRGKPRCSATGDSLEDLGL